LLVRHAQDVFRPAWEATRGDDGFVSFELEPLLEDPERNRPPPERTRWYIELGTRWSEGQANRMIKVPNTDAGVAALEELAAAGITLNVTLTFTPRQYVRARDAIWRGAQQRRSLDRFKSVYGIFVSRVDVYTAKHVPQLSPKAQGMVGIVNAKHIWRMNEEFWADKQLPLKQEIVFASTGVKTAGDPPWKYVEAFAGSGIETNPPATNKAVQESGRTCTRQVDQLPPDDVLAEINRLVNMDRLETTLMTEGISKFADPQKALLTLIAENRRTLRAPPPAGDLTPAPPAETQPGTTQRSKAVADVLVQLGNQADPRRVAQAVKAQSGIEIEPEEVVAIRDALRKRPAGSPA
jgi:transaldolase